MLQIGAAIINRGRFVTNWGSYYKARQICYKLGQLLQIEADLLQIGAAIINRDRFVTNWGSYYKSRQICYKLGQLL